MSPSFTTVTMCSSCLLLYRLQCLVGLRQIYHNYDFGNSKVVNLLLAKHIYIYIYIYILDGVYFSLAKCYSFAKVYSHHTSC